MSEAFEEIAIVALNSRGDGVAADGVVVPAALPGERTRVRLQGRHAELVEVLTPSPERAQPFCPWFGRCGGCATQHMSDGLYRNWKRGLVIDALKRATVAAKVGPLIDAHGAGRRRAVFHARFPHGAPDEVGFMRLRSHDIVAIDVCPLFAPAMAGAVEAAQTLARDLRGLAKPLDIGVTATLDGLDVDLRGSGPLDLAEARKLARTAEALDLARVSNHGVNSSSGVRRGSPSTTRSSRFRQAVFCRRPKRAKPFSQHSLRGRSQMRGRLLTSFAAPALSRFVSRA